MTKTGVPMGTPLYMSPEHCQGRGMDHRSDIYSLGVMLYRMFCGSEPFTGGTTMEVMLAHMTLPPPPPRQLATLPEELEGVILQCLAKDKAERPESVATLRALLLPLLDRLAAGGGVAPEKLCDAPALPTPDSAAMQALVGGAPAAAAPARRPRWLYAVATGFGVVAMAVLAVVLLWPKAQPVTAPALAPATQPAPPPKAPETAARPAPGRLVVRTNVKKATFKVDEKVVGDGAGVLKLDTVEPGKHSVGVQAAGYEPRSEEVEIAPRGLAALTWDLRPVVAAAPRRPGRPPPPTTTRPAEVKAAPAKVPTAPRPGRGSLIDGLDSKPGTK
ncbi:MAG: protein kinase [Deltaproteobacteria bacterium]|nr:protein kinase [Deltaproteobacteria bacterium]